MALLPEGSLLTITDGTFTGTVAVKAIRYRALHIPIIRTEFTGDKQRSAKNIDGSDSVIVKDPGNAPFQYFNNCNPNDEARPLGPDDDRIDDIWQRFNVVRFEVEGANSIAAQVDAIFNIRKNHVTRLARFDAHFEIVRGDVSFAYLRDVAQQEDFDFITDTNCTMSGPSLGVLGPQTDVVIVEFSPDVTRENPDQYPVTSSTLYKEWSMIIEHRTIVPYRSTIFDA